MAIVTSDGKAYEDWLDYHSNQPMNPDEPKKIYFVRHGATVKNEEGTDKHDQPVRGWSPDGLDADGRKDAEKAAENVRGLPIEHIVASDLPRAAETATTISRKLGIPLEFDPGLRTWDLGGYTGKSGKDVHDEVDRLCLRSNDEKPPPGDTPGESFNEFKDRILGTMSGIVQRHKDKEILVVSHNSPERVLHAWDAAGQPEAQNRQQKPQIRPEQMDNPEWYKDPKLDWNKVPMGKLHQFKEVPKSMKNFTDPDYNPNPMYDFIQKQIDQNKLKPGDGFTIHENDGDKTYQYMGPHLPPGQNFFLKPPTGGSGIV